jgi:anti-sigma regulatory factor (Ser/Thr protein kinase)
VTVLYAVLDPSTRQLHYTSAGHPPALVVSDRGSTYLSAPPSPPVGVTTDGTYKVATQELPAGSALVLYTDGLVERRGVSLTDGLERLRSAADAVASDDVERLCDHLLASLIHRDHVADDIALVALRPLPLAGQPLHLDVPAEARFLARARANLRHWLRESGATPAEESDLLVAVGEACANVVQHAYPAAPGRLQIEARIEDGVLDVWVRDEGRWRAPADRGGGWGLKLMRALTDSVDVARNPHGTVVHLRRLLGIRVGSST